MNIAIDISPLKVGHFLQHRVRGTGFYLENIRKALLKYYPKNKYTFFTRGEKLPDNIDLVHYPYFEPFFLTLPFLAKKKAVVTVHDLTPFVFPKYFPAGIRGKIKWLIQKSILKRIGAVVTDSLSSKRDIIKYAGLPDENVNVIYPAAGEEFRKNVYSKEKLESFRKKYNLPEKFVIYVGDVTWNKNLPRLISAMKKVKIPLVIVGKALNDESFDVNNPWNQDLVKVKELIENDNRFIRLGFVSADDLVLLYNIAEVFIMPSLYEGFGLPILEALSCGCPVVTSKEGSIPEIAGDSAYYIDAYNTDSIADGIKKVFSNDKIKNELVRKGFIQAKKFNWKKTSDQLIELYSSLLE